MHLARLEEVQRFLEELRAAVPELKGVLVALNEGLPVSHSFANGADPQRVAAKAVLAVIAPSGANTGFIHLEARHTTSGIGQLF